MNCSYMLSINLYYSANIQLMLHCKGCVLNVDRNHREDLIAIVISEPAVDLKTLY